MLPDYAPPKEPYLDILYEDEHLLVLNKQSGLLSVPGRHEHLKDCLESRVQSRYPTASTIHRLDMETSGILVMALSKEIHGHIGRQFEHRRTEKTYIARVAGHMAKEEGEVDLPLICDWPNRPRQMVDFERGKQALTRWRVLEREDGNITRLELKPVTGRSHQLRVHCQQMGHSILGDPFYASDEVKAMTERLQLHAHSLTLFHPVKKEKVTFTSPVPF